MSLTCLYFRTGTVGFSAYYNFTGQQLLVTRIIQFDSVDTNVGGHYDPTNSTFTCPTSGLYHFSINVQNVMEPGLQAFVYLQMDTFDDASDAVDKEYLTSTLIRVRGRIGDEDKVIAQGKVYDWTNTTDTRGSASAVVWCSEGSTVVARSLAMGAVAGGVDQFKLSTFNGFLII